MSWGLVGAAAVSTVGGALLNKGKDGSSGGGISSDGGGAEATPPPPFVDIPTTGWGGMGPTPTPQTYTQQGMPSWMRQDNAPQQMGYVQGQPNWFAAPWWGTDAATGNQLSQDDLMYQAPTPPPAQQQQMPEPSPGWGQPYRQKKPLVGFTGGMEWGDAMNLADDYRSPFSYSADEIYDMYGW